MALHNTGRRNISPEEFEKRKQEIAKMKVIAEESRQKRLYEKSAFFRNTPGKILWIFSLSVSLFCIVFIVDGWLGQKYTKYEIKSSSEDIVHLVKGGYLVASTFNWAYLDDEEKLGLHMHHDEFNLINEVGTIELGTSPVFSVPSNFKVKYESGRIETVPLEKNYIYLFFIPFFLFIISTIWLFAKPQKGFQWMMFGYFNMVVIPMVLLLLVLQIINYMNGIGMYEIDLRGLDLPST